MTTRRGGHTATLLTDGTVLVAGNILENDISQNDGLPSAELYDPGSGEWVATGGLRNTRISTGAVRLTSGKVLVAGGTKFRSTDAGFQSAEIYDPVAKTWSLTDGMTVGRYNFAAAPLTDGRALVAGGIVTAWPATATPSQNILTKTSEVFAP
jgi:hypothetical protein